MSVEKILFSVKQCTSLRSAFLNLVHGVWGINPSQIEGDLLQENAASMGDKDIPQSDSENQVEFHISGRKERQFTCGECDKKFYQRGEQPYKCHLCGRKFNRKDNLNAHLRTKGHYTPEQGIDSSCEMKNHD
ncbi:hypothetical protein NPIL_555381 [Nephila pilipes]|uniref:C2H2-type domain-containing protein n=1 Tax=Nephila pilipes TaxID=299642 RepID=A0A8X6P8L8_NEPPI|nr:hypothetical protein NPIL_555381 [Nephila pilipes]